ncbi:MAG: hypothetical protein ACLGH0_02935, partial [Thermoanaerobaculia bacterium]
MLNLAAAAIAWPLRFLPRSKRFSAAVWLSRALRPLLWPLLRRRIIVAFAGPYDETLRIVLRAAVRLGIEYDPRPEIDVPQDFVETIRARGGILVTGHFALNPLMSRYLYDLGIAPAPVRTYPELDPSYWGTDAPIEILKPSPTLLVKIRTRLAEKRPVIVTVDAKEESGRMQLVQTVFGTYYVSG